MSNSGISVVTAPLLTPEAVRATMTLTLQRRERFAARHPEIDIRAKREGGRLVFYVTEANSAVTWFDATAMMDDLEARYPDE
jgi:hypothetical protein